ncbi:MAG: NAD(P)H-binding protein [Nitriliruptoraceae bacterium]|nr:NAD(P)H-binding protein [Nitriliruptoraceae bacterium]
MPVLVTAAHEPLARRFATRLLEEGGEVRVSADGDVGSLRAGGAFVVQATIDDEGRLEAALEQVHTVVHVGGGLFTSEPGRIVVAAETLARAATGAGVKRIITLSLPGARHDAADPVRRAKARAEALIAEVACPTVVLRCGPVDTPRFRDALVTGGLDPEVLETEVAPVRVDDLAELVVAFDRARSSSREGHLVVRADGPQRRSLAGYLDTVVDRSGGTPSRVGRRLADPVVSERLASVLAGPWIDDDPALLDGWTFAELTPTAPGLR